MNTKDENPSERFQRAVSCAVRAIAGKKGEELEITFDSDTPHLTPEEARIPFPSRELNNQDVELVRGSADALALRLRYHDPLTHNKTRPRGKNARAIFEAVEQARIECLGAKKFAGVAVNLNSALEQRCRLKGYDLISNPEDSTLPDAIGVLVREKLQKDPLPTAAKTLADSWRPWFEEKVKDKLSDIANHAANQEVFGKLVRDLIQDLELEDENTDDPGDRVYM